MAFKRTVTLHQVFDFKPSDLIHPRYCCSADARMRMQNALLFTKRTEFSGKTSSTTYLRFVCQRLR